MMPNVEKDTQLLMEYFGNCVEIGKNKLASCDKDDCKLEWKGRDWFCERSQFQKNACQGKL